MTDSFKDQLERIARDARERLEREKQDRARRGKDFRDNVETAFKNAVAFNSRVITPVLAEFSSSALGAGEFTCEFKESESQPEFIHSCKLHGQRLAVSLLYWIAGSARLTCGFGYVLNDEPFKIQSFDEPELEDRAKTWLKSQLLQKYRAHMERTHSFDDADA